MLSFIQLATIHLATRNPVNFCVTSTMDKTHPGVFYSLFSYTGCVLSQQLFLFLLLLICCGYPNYNAQGAFVIIFSICSIFSNASEAFALQQYERKMAKAALKLSPQRKILTASSHFHCFDVFPVRLPQKFQVSSMVTSEISSFLYGYLRNFKFKQKYQQHGSCFQTIFQFLTTMLLLTFSCLSSETISEKLNE